MGRGGVKDTLPKQLGAYYSAASYICIMRSGAELRHRRGRNQTVPLPQLGATQGVRLTGEGQAYSCSRGTPRGV